MQYDWPVIIVRIIDSRKEQFKLGKLYSNRYEVVNVHTRPEAEMLVIANEGHFADYAKHKSKMKPSEYCVQTLGMGRIKSREYLQLRRRACARWMDAVNSLQMYKMLFIGPSN